MKDDEILFENEEDDEEQISNSNNGKIYTDKSDMEVESLYNKWKKGRLNIQPSYQRQFVWDIKKSSMLIESILLEIPIPIIYLSEEKDNTLNVIDGQQRLTAFFSYIDGAFPDKKEFRLSGLKIKKDLNGKKYKDLDNDTQDKISTYNLRVIKFTKDSDHELQFEMFSRLNTGSVSLNAQELRNCIYRGKFNDLIKELADYTEFKRLLGLQKSEKRMKDRELVLRFAAFHFKNYQDYVSPIKTFLNNTMEKYKDISDNDADELKIAFKTAVSTIYSIFNDKAFKRFYIGDNKNKDCHWETKTFNESLYDILMYSLSREDKNIIMQNADAIREALMDLMTSNEDFIESIGRATSNTKILIKRFDIWRNTLDSIIGNNVKQPRCFSYTLKEQLFNNDNTCEICRNKILSIDDAAVDHIKQYWAGGQTIPSNARLTHRYCNNARARKQITPNVQLNLIQQQGIKPIKNSRRPKTTFKMLNIPVGSELLFKNDISVKCKTADETNQVVYEGEFYSISDLSSKLADYRTSGFQYFLFNRKTLADIRRELEASN